MSTFEINCRSVKVKAECYCDIIINSTHQENEVVKQSQGALLLSVRRLQENTLSPSSITSRKEATQLQIHLTFTSQIAKPFEMTLK